MEKKPEGPSCTCHRSSLTGTRMWDWYRSCEVHAEEPTPWIAKTTKNGVKIARPMWRLTRIETAS